MLQNRLPEVRGQYRPGFALSGVTWFRVGGPAEVLFKPADLADLQYFLAHKPKDIPVFTMGVGSNLLVRDGGIPGVVIRLGREFATLTPLPLGEGLGVRAGAAALDVHVAEFAVQQGMGGLEFLSGIPGTIGGALFMNAGAYGSEIKDVLLWAEGVDAQGKLYRLTPEQCGFSYRHSSVPEGFIFTGAALKAVAKPESEIRARMAEISASREASQPVKSRTGGSTFANPPGKKAWQLIDAAGLRGYELGGAQISPMHCNFLINNGTATAAELEGLGEEARAKVKAQSGIDLRWEIQRVGVTSE